MKREDKILLTVFAAVLISALGLLSLSKRERIATIQFTDATWAADGRLTTKYTSTVSDGMVLLNLMSGEGDKQILFAGCGPASVFPRHISIESPGDSYFLAGESNMLHSLLVKTGIVYTVTSTNSLVLYDFTNAAGTRFRREFVLKRYLSK